MFFAMWLSTFVDPVSNETLLSPIPKGNYKLQISLAQNNNNATKHFFFLFLLSGLPVCMWVKHLDSSNNVLVNTKV